MASNMEELLAALAGPASSVEDCQNTHSLNSSDRHTTSDKHLTRKRSVFALAAEFFKSNTVERAKTSTIEHEKQERMKGQWNPFASLRGLRDSRRKTTTSVDEHFKSSSPQKNSDLGVDEFGSHKAMRRKSLQDLLGTVGSKFTLPRRRLPGDNMIPQCESPTEESRESCEISPLVLPEPIIPLPEPPIAPLGSLYLYSKDLTSKDALEPQINVTAEQSSEITPSSGLKPSFDPCSGASREAELPSNIPERSSTPEMRRYSQDLKRVSPSVSPERVCQNIPIKDLHDISPHVSAHVRFVDGKDPIQYRYNENLEDKSSEFASLDPLFLARALSREARYNSICSGPDEACSESTKDVEKKETLNAKLVKKGQHISIIQSGWSADNSESDADSTSNYDWVEKEIEVQDVIERGNEIMKMRKLSSYLQPSTTCQLCTASRRHSGGTDSAVNKTDSDKKEKTIYAAEPFQIRGGASSYHEESFTSAHQCLGPQKDRTTPASYVMLVSSSGEAGQEHSAVANLAITDGRSRTLDKDSTQTFNCCRVNQDMKSTISLETEETFPARQMDSRVVSTEPVHVYYPPSEFRTATTKTYLSKSNAIRDLCQNCDGLSDYCLFDRNTRTFYPQTLSDPVPDLSQSSNEWLEVFWFPLEMFPAVSLINRMERENGKSDILDQCTTDLNGLSLTGDAPASASNSDFIATTIVKDANAAVSYGAEGIALSSNDSDDAYLEYGAWVGYSNLSPHADAEGVKEPNYCLTNINAQDASGTITGGMTSEDLQPTRDDMEDSYNMVLNSATKRLDLDSSSSCESLQPAGQAKASLPDSANSIWRKSKDSQPEGAKKAKTWLELERDFLNKFAPDSQMSPRQRGRLAVYESFKKLSGWLGSPEDHETIAQGDSDLGSQNAPSTEKEKWLRYRDAYEGAAFYHVEDIAKYKTTEEAVTKIPMPSYVRAGSTQSLSDGPCSTVDLNCKGDKIDGIIQCVQESLVELGASRNHVGEKCLEKQAAGLAVTSTKRATDSLKPQEDRPESSLNSESGIFGSGPKCGSGESFSTEDIPIPMPAGYKFTKYAKQLTEVQGDTFGEELMSYEDEYAGQGISSGLPSIPTGTTFSTPVSKNICKPSPPNEATKTKVGNASHAAERSSSTENENFGLAISATVQVLPPAVGVSFATSRSEYSTSTKPGCPMNTEALSGVTPPTSLLVARNRVLTPSKRMTNPLTELLSQQSPAARSAPASEADTELSENFGHKLRRFGHAEEDEKENEDWWWRDSISYG